MPDLTEQVTAREYWNARYLGGDTSGSGSYGESLSRKIGWLANLPGIQTITDFGCGDFSFGESLLKRLPGARYIGIDPSDVIIERNRKKEARDNVSFLHGAVCMPLADLLLCIDVLFHIEDDAEYEATLRRLELAWVKYLALSAYEYDGLRKGHVFIRKFDPSRFGVPILREVIEDEGSMYFYIFKK